MTKEVTQIVSNEDFERVILEGWWDKLTEKEQIRLATKHYPQYRFTAIDGPEIKVMYYEEIKT